MAIPVKHAMCVPWMLNFSERMSADPARWMSNAADALAVAEAVAAYRAIYESLMQARAEGTWAMSATAARNAAREHACRLIRPIYARVQATREISDEDRISLGVHVLDRRPTRHGGPAGVPQLALKRLINRTLTISIRDPQSQTRRRRPAGCSGAMVFWCTGDAPAAAGYWHFAGNATRTTKTIALDNLPAAAATVWISAMWYGRRGQVGETSPALRVNLPAMLQAPVTIREAA